MEEVANTLDRSPVHDTATQKHKGQTTMKTQSSKGNLRLVNLTVRVGLWEEAGVWVTAHKKVICLLCNKCHFYCQFVLPANGNKKLNLKAFSVGFFFLNKGAL